MSDHNVPNLSETKTTLPKYRYFTAIFCRRLKHEAKVAATYRLICSGTPFRLVPFLYQLYRHVAIKTN